MGDMFLIVGLTGFLGVGKCKCVSEICLRPTPVASAMVTKIWKISQKIGYNWRSVGDMFLILAPSRGFSGWANLTV